MVDIDDFKNEYYDLLAICNACNTLAASTQQSPVRK